MNSTSRSLFNQGVAAFQRREYDRALEICELLSAQELDDPSRAACLNLQAVSLAQKGDMFRAEQCLDQALELKPEDAQLLHQACRVVIKTGHPDKASDFNAAALRRQPDNVTFLYQKARILYLQGEYRRAEDIALRCVSVQPGFDEAHVFLAELAREQGDLSLASKRLMVLARQKPGEPRAWALMSEWVTEQAATDECVRQLRQIFDQNQAGIRSATAGFALAAIHQTRDEHQVAFAFAEAANRTMRRLEPFDISRWESQTAVIPERKISSMAAVSDNSAGRPAQPLFIVGMPRSGTSLCEQLVSVHPDVHGGGELPLLSYVASALQNEDLAQKKPAEAEHWWGSMRQSYLAGLPTAARSCVWATDKAPRNFEHLDIALNLFPRARAIWMLRHPLDTILSCYFQDFGPGQNFSHDLQDCARFYRAQVRLMQTWSKRFGERIRTVRYDRLVSSLETEATGIAEFLGLPLDSRMLTPHLNPRAVKTASSEQVRQPVYTSSIGKWRHYEEELAATRKWLFQQGLVDEQGEMLIQD